MNFNIDLKNIDLKNISLEDIQAKLKKVDKKTWIKLGAVVGAIILLLIKPIMRSLQTPLQVERLKIT